MSRFGGFGPNALGFFKALAFHQSRDWFEANRALYEEEARAPMMALIEDLAERFAKEGLLLTGDGKRSLFRLNRDIRFSKDKSPYKTHLGAVMTRSGAKGEAGLLYLHISPEGCFVAAGFHLPEPAQLLMIRKTIQAKPASYAAMNKALAKGKLRLGEDGARLKRMPKGFEKHKDTPLADAFLRKSFIVEEALAEKEILRPALAGKIVNFAKRSAPLLDFGWAALGVA